MNILITILARGGSKGVPGKNIKDLNGMPVIAYSIKAARNFIAKYGGDAALSTDSSEIKAVCAKYGLATDYTRPAHLANDTVAKVEAIKDLVLYEEKNKNIKYDYILDLDVSSPMRNLKDLSEAFDKIRANEKALNLFSVSPAHRNPYFNMVEETADGLCKLSKAAAHFTTRQDSPKVYDINGSFYFYKRAFFDAENMKVVNDRSSFYIVPHVCLDIDTELDFEFISFIIKNNKLGFEL